MFGEGGVESRAAGRRALDGTETSPNIGNVTGNQVEAERLRARLLCLRR